MSRDSHLIGQVLKGHLGAVNGKLIRVIGWDPAEQKFVVRTLANRSKHAVGRMTHVSLDTLTRYYREVNPR